MIDDKAMQENEKRAEDASGTWLAGLNRAILDTALDCIITMDAAGIVREFNPAAERVFGYRREQAVGRELAQLIIPPALRERHRQGLAHYLKTGEGPVLGRRIEIPALCADDTEILVELAITAYRIQGEQIFTAYLRDITERLRTERRRTAQYGVASLLASSMSLSEGGAQILKTIAASGDWVFGSIWLNNEEKATLNCAVTWQADGNERSEFNELTHGMTLPHKTGLPGRVVATREPTWVADVTHEPNFPRAGAARRAGLCGAFAFPLFAEGKIQGVLELFSPMVVRPDDDLFQLMEALGSQIGLFIHRGRLEKELQAQKEAAEAANAAKDRFLATLSHELRTPLTPVLIWAGGTVQQPDLPPDIAEGLRMICRNVELEARLIDDLLDLTRITRGKLKLDRRSANVHGLLRQTIEIVRSDLDTREIKLELHLDASHPTVSADAARLQQVFWNVLRNAIKFTEVRGTVSIRTSNQETERLFIEVSDNGVGIAPESLEKIFDAFEQMGERREGLGLGLAISKAIVERHGGSMRAVSEGAGKGASFLIELSTAPEP